MVKQAISLIENEIFECINDLTELLVSIKQPVAENWQDTFLECLQITLPVVRDIKDKTKKQLDWMKNQYKYYNPNDYPSLNNFEYQNNYTSYITKKKKITQEDEDDDYPL